MPRAPSSAEPARILRSSSAPNPPMAHAIGDSVLQALWCPEGRNRSPAGEWRDMAHDPPQQTPHESWGGGMREHVKLIQVGSWRHMNKAGTSRPPCFSFLSWNSSPTSSPGRWHLPAPTLRHYYHGVGSSPRASTDEAVSQRGSRTRSVWGGPSKATPAVVHSTRTRI